MISITNLSKSYGSRKVLDDISLQINRGETVVILGHSGSGKSTLLRTIIGLVKFEAGRIEVDHQLVSPDLPLKARQEALRQIRLKCGTVFQQYHLFPHMTILDNITLAPVHVGKINRSQAQSRATDLLKIFGLEHKALSRPHELSGGEQQRVAIARAMALSPHYLLYDEPTSALDPARSREMWAIMAELAQKGQTQIIVTHQEQIQEALPCRIVRIQEGRIISDSDETNPPALFQ